jgi:hypothetical protein
MTRTSRLIACTLFLVFLGCARPAAAADERASTAPRPHGLALVYVLDRFRTRAVVEGDLTLPRVAANRDSYGVWFMLIARPEGVDGTTPFVEGGLIRRASEAFRLAPFRAVEREGERGFTTDVAPQPLPDGTYHVRLAVDDGRITIDVGGIRVLDAARDDVFGPESRLYLQLGSETIVAGDRQSGELRNVTIRGDDDDAPRRVSGACRFVGRGITIDGANGDFTARGTLAQGGEQRFVGASCADDIPLAARN